MSENRLFCDTCIGKKYVIGMGMIHQDCPKCKGLGYRENSDLDSEKSIPAILNIVSKEELTKEYPNVEEAIEIDIPVIVQKKKGRPKKSV